MGKKLVTPRTQAMRNFMQEIVGGNKMRLQTELDRVSEIEINCNFGMYASATVQDDYGKSISKNAGTALDNKALAGIAYPPPI